jgi:MFS family permease
MATHTVIASERVDEACNSSPSAQSRRGLDWFNFFAADVRTGVGPFVAVYLMNQNWNVAQIGVALTAAELAGVVTQAPGGAIMDRLRSKRLLLGIALVALAVSALFMATFPTMPVVVGSQIVLGVTGSIFGPGISALTLGLVSYACLGARTGRNAAFGSAGNVIAALTMGWIGYQYGPRSIFYLVVLLTIPAILTLMSIKADEIDFDRARGGSGRKITEGWIAGLRLVFCDKRMITFAVLTVLWHLGNGAMLAMIGEQITHDRPQESTLWMAAAVTVPQLIMTMIGPAVGHIADVQGRKPILLWGFLFLPLRALFCAFTSNPYLLITFQILDGLAAGIFGIVGILMIADLSRGTGHYNLALGTIGAMVGIGASISTTLAGFVTQEAGFRAGYLCLAAAGLAALLVLGLLMPETLVREKEVDLAT